MWKRPLATFVLVSSIVMACGSRSDLLGIAGVTPREAGSDPESGAAEARGSTPDASAPVDAGPTVDATATVGTCAFVEGVTTPPRETDGAACQLPFQTLYEIASGACTALPGGGGCGSSEYQLTCNPGKTMQQIFDGLGCNGGPGGVQDGVACCPCGGTSALCVEVDASTYDRSCTRSEDCMSIASGKLCNGGCVCPDTAVNVGGKSRYQQTLACIPQGAVCNCPAEGIACCVRGQCTTTFNGCPDWD